MKVVLLERVENLGAIGDVVTVKDGFARNFLLPRDKARRATSANLKAFELDRAAIEKIVHEYIVNHPEVLEEAMAALEKKQAAEASAGRASTARWVSSRTTPGAPEGVGEGALNPVTVTRPR